MIFNCFKSIPMTSEHRTRVIDDESDYFNADSNKWLNPKQRDALRSKEQELRESRHGSKRAIKVTLDFAGKKSPPRHCLFLFKLICLLNRSSSD